METAVTPIREALYRGSRAEADELLAKGAALNVFDAAALGDTAQLRSFFAADASLAHEWSADGFTALHFAAYLGGPEAVRVCLDAGSDVAAVARNDMRVQPLHSAAANGNVESCRLLLEAGADVNARQQRNFTPMDEAQLTRNEPMIALFDQYGGK
jgi:ankyrin repeat protein